MGSIFKSQHKIIEFKKSTKYVFFHHLDTDQYHLCDISAIHKCALIDQGVRTLGVIFAPETKFHSSLAVKYKSLPSLLKSEVSRAKVKHSKKKQQEKDMAGFGQWFQIKITLGKIAYQEHLRCFSA